jgi:hypothetical protein
VAQPSSKDIKDLEAVPYHKRIAMGANLDGSSLQSKGSQPKDKGGVKPEQKKK